MSFWTRMRSFLGFGPQLTSTTGPGSMLAGLFQSGQPPTRGTVELLRAYAQLPHFHAVIHRIATDVAGWPFELYRPGSTRGARAVARHLPTTRTGPGYHRFVRRALEAGDLIDLPTHPFLEMLRRPNPSMTGVDLRWLLTAYLDTRGEVPIIIERDTEGLPIELWPTPPHWLQLTPSKLRPTWRFGQNSWAYEAPGDAVLYMRHPDLTNPYGRGIGQGLAAADELDIDEFAARHLKTWFFNRALPDAFISIEGVTSKTEAERYETLLRNKHQGLGKGSQIHVASGKVTVQPISQTFKDQQVREIRLAARDTQHQIYSVPPEVMGILENSNRATIDSAFYLYAKIVLLSRLTFQADQLARLAQEWDPALIVSFDSPVPEDRDFVRSIMTAQPTCFSRNEWREAAGFDPRPGWSDQFPAENPGATPAAPASPAPEPDADEPQPDPDEEAAVVPMRR